MNATQFQNKYAGELKAFFETSLGKNLLGTLNGLRPLHEVNPVPEHILLKTYAKIEGYELCLRNIVGLTMLPIEQKPIEADYGVKEPKQDIK